ncbi:agmatine deiminase family protein [Algiphilus sp.]|uniref:agmatine deiminase family protein n=1 Tax=Algiphilus sp. TaxID=1872431 RepID=UPI003B5219F3
MSIFLPAEWAPQAAVQLTWPHADGDFGPMLDEAHDQFVRLAVAIAEATPLLVVVPDRPEARREELLARGVAAERLRMVMLPSNDVWARDHGPITVWQDDGARHLDFRFDGWGGKFDARLDNALTARLADQGLLPGPTAPVDWVLEGGSIESDGAGTILTTERCLLDTARNPGATQENVEAMLRHQLGAQRVLWLAHGDLLGDDTDGHIDTLARFCRRDCIAYQACDDPSDAHFETLGAMADELSALRTAEGTPYTLIPLPLPAAAFDPDDGHRLPAGYANFLISNALVLVPTYDDPADAIALARLQAAFPEHRVRGVDCRTLIRQHGSLHCVTMQIPSQP